MLNIAHIDPEIVAKNKQLKALAATRAKLKIMGFYILSCSRKTEEYETFCFVHANANAL